MNKSKKGPNLVVPSELTFVTSVPLEEVLLRLSEMANEAHPLIVTEINADSYRFEWQYKAHGKISAVIDGSLRRWQGTSTRVRLDRRIGADRHFVRHSLMTITALVLLFILAMALGFTALWAVQCALFFTVVPITIVTGFSARRRRWERITAGREADYLIDRLLAVVSETADEFEWIDERRDDEDTIFKQAQNRRYINQQ